MKITIDNLCQAVQTNEIDIVKLVAKRIRNVCQKGTNGKTAIELAYDMSNPEIKHLLSKRAFSFILRETASEQDKMEKLRQNLDNKTKEIYNLMVKSSIQTGGVSSGLMMPEKVPIVMLAAELQLMDIIKWLVEKGANPNSLLKSGIIFYLIINLLLAYKIYFHIFLNTIIITPAHFVRKIVDYRSPAKCMSLLSKQIVWF